MDTAEARRRFSSRPVARLATVRPDGSPHLVPVTFACDGDIVYWAVDAKPKRSTQLQRLQNIDAEPRCSLLADHYDDDWAQLWWVRADGRAAIADHDGVIRARAFLAARYRQYREAPPEGPVVAVTVTRWRGWSAS